jgi:hypothetical protein
MKMQCFITLKHDPCDPFEITCIESAALSKPISREDNVHPIISSIFNTSCVIGAQGTLLTLPSAIK